MHHNLISRPDTNPIWFRWSLTDTMRLLTSFLLACFLRSTHAGRGVGADEAVVSTKEESFYRDGPGSRTDKKSELSFSALLQKTQTGCTPGRYRGGVYRNGRTTYHCFKTAGRKAQFQRQFHRCKAWNAKNTPHCQYIFKRDCKWRSLKLASDPGGYCQKVFMPKFCKKNPGIQKTAGCKRYFMNTMRRRSARGSRCRSGLKTELFYQPHYGKQVFRSFTANLATPVYTHYERYVNIRSTWTAGIVHGWRGSRARNFQMRGLGYLNIAQTGKYKFCLTSSDGSRLRINHKFVVKNGGLHGARTRCGYVKLRRGSHFVNVEAFNHRSGFVFIWKYSGRDTANRMVLVGTKGPIRQCKTTVYKPYKNTKRTQTVCGTSVVRPRCHGAGCHYRKSYNHGGGCR